MVCAGGLIVKLAGLEVPPPGAGFLTVTLAVPADARFAAGICAVTRVAFTKVVGCAAPFHCMTEVERKFVPFTVNVKVGPPAVALVGEILVVVGMGLLAAMILKTAVGDVPPPGGGFVTVTCTVPAVEISAAEMAAVIWVALASVVGRALPFQLTIELPVKPAPFTFKLNAGPPEVTLVGEIEANVGMGFGGPGFFPPPQPPLNASHNKTPDATTTRSRSPGFDLISLLLRFPANCFLSLHAEVGGKSDTSEPNLVAAGERLGGFLVRLAEIRSE